MREEHLLEKIKSLPPELAAEVEEFIESLTRRNARDAVRERHEAISAYAAEHGGSDSDLDTELESAAVEHLLASEATDL